MGRILADADELPDSVVASSAVRAETTVRLAADEGAWPTPIRVTDLLYNTRPEEVLAEVAAEPDTTARLMIVGHEPTWSALLSELVGGGRHPFPTAAIARVDLPTDSWSLLQPGSGELRWILPPRLAAAVIGE
jgi:phosphohistidine phosphatase